MPQPEQRDWNEVFLKARDWAENKQAFGEKLIKAELARFLNIKTSTLGAAMDRYGLTMDNLVSYVDGQGRFETYIKAEDGDKIDVKEEGENVVSIESRSVSGQIRSVEQLIKASNFDEEKYIIKDPQVKKWDVGMKVKVQEHLQKVVVIPLHYVAFRGIKRHPEPIAPVIHPVTFGDTVSIPRPRTCTKKFKRGLIIADPQVGFSRRLHTGELSPFHDRRVLDIALQILKSQEFDYVEYIGDMLDMSEWSTHWTAEPEFYWTTQPALIELAWWLRQYREAAPGAEMDYFEGNHDMRPKVAITKHLKAAYGLRPVDELELPPNLSVSRLLALHELHINYVANYPDAKRWLNRNVLVRHGHIARANPGDTAKAIANKYRYTTIFGHIHRPEMVTVRMQDREGDVFATGFCPGCACHIDGRVPGATSESQWKQGLAVIEFTDDEENIVPIAVSEGRAIYNGKVYQAREMNGKMDEMILKALRKIKV
jgi:metallophosphoesterase superfamily enzyme